MENSLEIQQYWFLEQSQDKNIVKDSYDRWMCFRFMTLRSIKHFNWKNIYIKLLPIRSLSSVKSLTAMIKVSGCLSLASCLSRKVTICITH